MTVRTSISFHGIEYVRADEAHGYDKMEGGYLTVEMGEVQITLHCTTFSFAEAIAKAIRGIA